MRATLALIFCAIILVAITALTGNSDAIDPAAIQDTIALPLELRDPVGQTFIPHFQRLHAIQVRFIIPNDFTAPRDAHVTLHLRASPTDSRDLASASMPLDQIRNNEFAKFSFAPLADSGNRTYYFFFDASINGLALWSSSEDAYADGALYANVAPLPRDLVFRAYYEPDLGMLLRALAQTLTRFPVAILIFALVLFFFAVSPVLQRTHYSPRSEAEWGCGASVAHPFAPFVFLCSFALLVCLALSVALLQIRDLPVPLWVDSLAHAQYVQFILTHTRLPTENFYHLGFHVLAALFSAIFNLSIPISLLLVGQFSWVLVGGGVYFLSRKNSGSDVAGLVSATCVWFLSPTPAYLITWGRYPLVLGSALLSLALLCMLRFWAQKDGRNLFFGVVTFSALAFTQIRLIAFYFAFFAIWVALQKIQARRQSPIPCLQPLISKQSLTLFISFFLPIILWFLYLLVNGVTVSSILAQIQTAPEIDAPTVFEVWLTQHGVEFYSLAALAAILGLARRTRVAFLMLGWLGLMLLVSLIFGALVPLSLVLLLAFLPAAILIGDATRWVYERSGASYSIVRAAVWAALIGSVSILGARNMVNIANPATILFTRADENAMRWISANTPRDSVFLVNSFNWVGEACLPNDGGGWIPYVVGNPIVSWDVCRMYADWESNLTHLIESRNIQFVYLSTRAGSLNISDFTAHPEKFSPVYDRGGVKIFQIR